MKLLTAKASNFASYTDVAIDYTSPGLTLIFGDTGSGKSTLFDLPSWILWGRTAKDGAADDVRSWNNDEPTAGVVTIRTQVGVVTVSRTRGKPSDNDLWFSSVSGVQRRGKDMNETQILINQVLGITFDEFVISSYYHEYSGTRNFFDSNSKLRREIFESLIDLSFVTSFQDGLSAERKKVKAELDKARTNTNVLVGKREQCEDSIINLGRRERTWEEDRQKEILRVTDLYNNFEVNKSNKLRSLSADVVAFEDRRATTIKELRVRLEECEKFLLSHSSKCKECGSLNKEHQKATAESSSVAHKIDKAISETNPFERKVAEAEAEVNEHSKCLDTLKSSINPHTASIDSLEASLGDIATRLDTANVEVKNLEHASNVLDHLQKLSVTLRSKLLLAEVKRIQDETNRLMETHFDSLFKVEFEVEKDNLKTTIFKDSRECGFRQLSKGQKCLLKLCFSVAAIKSIASRVSTNVLFMDEALDGLDTGLKLRSFNLLTELSLEREAVYIIDHDQELQGMFNKRCKVVLINGESAVQED